MAYNQIDRLFPDPLSHAPNVTTHQYIATYSQGTPLHLP